MKLLKTLFATALLGLATISSAQAHGDVGWSISIGSPYYAPPVAYHAAPPVVYYYGAPPMYYRAAPTVVYSPYISYGWRDGYRHDGWKHHGWRGEHRGWGRGEGRGEGRGHHRGRD